MTDSPIPRGSSKDLASKNQLGSVNHCASTSPTGSINHHASTNLTDSFYHHASKSQTGSFILAQGNALGNATTMMCRLKACLIPGVARRFMKQAYSLQSPLNPLPRALPWAMMSEPVGLKTVPVRLKTESGGLNTTWFVAFTKWPLALISGLVGINLLVAAHPITAATFDEQRTAIAASPATQSEAAILALLKTGLDEGKPTQAISEATKWLQQNQPEDAMLLYYAGRAAELSGNWKNAVPLYQQYLKNADLKSATADEAVYAVYTLLIERLNDPASAYSFGRTDGGRLLACPRARQFDQWFLDQAVTRQDGVALTNRLRACIEAGLPTDLISVRYTPYFRWLLVSVDGYCDPPTSIVTQDLYDAIKDLCDVMTVDDEMKLRLDWAISIRAYNLAKLGDKAKTVISRKPGKGKGLPKSPSNKQPGKKGTDKNAADAQAIEEKNIELGNDAEPPIAEASALLEKFPRYAMWVMTGWSGGGDGPYYRGDPKMYWPHEAEAKMAPILKALAKLTTSESAELLNALGNGTYVRTPGIFELKSVQDFVKANPAMMNGRNGVLILEKEWNLYTPEEAQKLAPQIAQCSHPKASLIRAIAAGSKDFDKVMAALLGPEVWRLSATELNGTYADGLWHYCGRPGDSVKRDAEIAKSKAVASALVAGDAKKDDPADKRIAAFRMLLADFRSPQPKLPAVRSRMAAVLKFTPEVVPELLKDPSLEAQSMVRDAIALGLDDAKGPLERDERARGISYRIYSPWFQRYSAIQGGADRVKQDPKIYLPHPLEPVLRQAVADGLAQNKLESWQVMAWLNLQFPENNAEQVKLVQGLIKSPAWPSMPADVKFGALDWFKKDVMTPGQIAWLDAADPKLACKDLLSLPITADAATAAAALQSAIDGVKKSPVRMNLIGLDKLAAVTNPVFADPKVLELVLEIADQLRDPCKTPSAGKLLFQQVSEKRNPVTIHRTANYLWSYPFNNDQRDPFPAVKKFAESLLDNSPSAASTMARVGLQVFEGAGGAYAFNPVMDMPSLKTLSGNAAMKMGLLVIPVAQNDPAYPIYKSQADWQGGNEDSALKLLDENWQVFLPIYREFGVPYLMWVLERVIQSRDETRQEALIKLLMGWSTEAGCPLTPTERANIEIAYGDIALQRGQLREARELFLRTQQNKAYQDLPVRHQATLRRVRVERISKDFEAALKTLAELELEREPTIWSATRFARAEVHFDREDFDEAADDIDSILAREPNNEDAKILLGKVQLKRKKLMEATEIELGANSNRESLVPGERLKVTLNDPTLAVSGAGSGIEVVVRAKSGDEETFFLRQFGDQKTKFRGEVTTALGAPTSGDGILQVIGDDEVFYAYSERFRKQMNNLDEMRGGPIRIASDATLMASARKLLTADEQRTADMQAVMDELKGKVEGNLVEAARGKLAARSLDASARSGNKEDPVVTDTRFISNITKPGNPIYVRVVDPDRSRTSNIDELAVSVASGSGDSVSQITLRETGPYTGMFEGTIPTTAAQALAFGTNSEPGRNPNMVISALDTYPAWQPVAKAGTTPEFTVDLNDNVALGELKITAAEAGRKFKKFLIQTGMNATDMTTVGVYPQSLTVLENPWSPSVTVINDTDQFHIAGGRSVYDLGEISAHMSRGWMSQQFAQGIAQNVAGAAEAMPPSIPTTIKWMRQNQHAVSSVIYRFQGYFHEPTEVTRRFRLDLGNFEIPKNTHPSINHPPQFLLAIDGKAITVKDGKLEGEAELQPGIHRFEIWGTGWVNNIGFGRSVKLLANLTDSDQMVDCPDKFFDPASFPLGLLDHRNGPAKITANNDSTVFTATFAKDSQARLIRLIPLSQEGPVPMLNKLALTTPEGKKILPVAKDFATLNKNDTLEIIVGDRITVRYLDDRPITAKKDKHERFLDVAFTDAKVEFADIEPRFNGGSGEDKPYHETLLRFHHDAPLSLVINDADMDVSVTPDKVKVTLTSEASGSREYEALETGDSTGIFKLVITPVSDKAVSNNQFQIAAGGTVTARYRDAENNRPGVPIERVATIAHAAFTPPVIRLAQTKVSALDPKNRPAAQALVNGFERVDDEARTHANAISELVSPRWQIDSTLLGPDATPDGGFTTVHGHPLYIEVVAPHLALGMNSEVTVYAQTESGRRLTSPQAGSGFDINVAGTIELPALLPHAYKPPGLQSGTPQLATYTSGSVFSTVGTMPDDRFRLDIPLIAGVIPRMGVISAEERKALTQGDNAAIGDNRTDALVVSLGETVCLGFRFRDATGKDQWVTASTKVITHPVFDIMSENFRSPVTSAYVGETLNLRVVDLGADTSDKSDTCVVLVQAKSEAKSRVELRETGPHTGIFKGGCTLAYANPAKPAPAVTPEPTDADVVPQPEGEAVQVVYGDTVAARYTDSNGIKTDTVMVTISKGADGGIRPFSKTYKDPDIAMRSQFSLAEAYLEMAKRHRLLGESAAADLEYVSAKQLLASAMDQFTDPETRAHAEYLLGSLTFEEADATADAAMKQERYRAALARFMNVTGSYPDTVHASKAQYRIALVYEALKEPEIAAQEYVKLAYKYPDSEFIATAMARLGSHFLKTATAYEEKAKPLLAKAVGADGVVVDKDAMFEGQALQKMASNEFIKTARIFGRLQERFPDNELAGQAGLRAGQAYFRALRHQDALTAFLRVVAEEGYDGPNVRAQAMYWVGMCYQELRQPMAAYSIFKRLTYDFPESQWAAYARAQLSQESMIKLETNLELNQLERENEK